MVEANTHSVEILQHRVEWRLSGENAPVELDESSLEHIGRLIAQGYREGELLVTGDDGETTFRGWWNIDWT